MSLVTLDLPSPAELRGGWAAFAAVCASRGWGKDVFATPSEWFYHDGGGNWASLRFDGEGRAVLIGHDHEYSDTYFGAAAEEFGEEETDLLAGAPEWWSRHMQPSTMGDFFGFIYGWDGSRWQRAEYEPNDGFRSVGLLKACGVDDNSHLAEFTSDAPGLQGGTPAEAALAALVAADAKVTEAQVAAVVPGWDVAAAMAAATAFLDAVV